MDITSLIQGIGIPIIIGIVLVLLQLQLIKDELKKQTKIMELNNKETQ
jgi:uncharacterized membrane-anchored protein YhcB (DUF1043 family)